MRIGTVAVVCILGILAFNLHGGRGNKPYFKGGISAADYAAMQAEYDAKLKVASATK